MSETDALDARSVLREPIFAMLEAYGVHTVEVAYSGGSDEGDTGEVSVTYIDGHDADELPLDEVPNWARDWAAARLVSDRPEWYQSAEPTLEEILAEPVWERWGGFDGPDEVDGTIVWQVDSRSVLDRFSQRTWTDGEEAA